MRAVGWAIAIAWVLGCGEISEQPTSSDCQAIREKICADAKIQGVGPNPCSDGGDRYAGPCETLREKCGGVLPTPMCS